MRTDTAIALFVFCLLAGFGSLNRAGDARNWPTQLAWALVGLTHFAIVAALVLGIRVTQ
jgi:hypothetical protein